MFENGGVAAVARRREDHALASVATQRLKIDRARGAALPWCPRNSRGGASGTPEGRSAEGKSVFPADFASELISPPRRPKVGDRRDLASNPAFAPKKRPGITSYAFKRGTFDVLASQTLTRLCGLTESGVFPVWGGEQPEKAESASLPLRLIRSDTSLAMFGHTKSSKCLRVFWPQLYSATVFRLPAQPVHNSS